MRTIAQHERQRRKTFWGVLLCVTAIGAVVVAWLVGPAPPASIRLATGNIGGEYAVNGQVYAEILRDSGLHVEVIPSAGSLDNLNRLVAGTVQAALVQSGTYPLVDDPDGVVRGVASLYREPLWLLYRADREMNHLSDLRGKKISIGLPGSGTEVLARVLLRIANIDEEDPNVVNSGMSSAVDRLVAGELDAAVLVTSADNELILKALASDGIRLKNFRRHVAFTKTFPYLSSVELTEGVLDMKRNIPPASRFLVSPVALLVCHKDLHPRVVEQLLQAAEKIHSSGTRIDQPGEYPSQESMQVPIHETARDYLRSGGSFLSRLLPYSAQRWVFKIQILAIPVLTLWFPFFKLLPLLYVFRVNSLLKLHYAALRDIETRIEQADNRATLVERMEELETLRQDMEEYSKKMPAFYQRHIYQWRLHLTVVQQEAAGYLQKYAKTHVNDEVDEDERKESSQQLHR